MWNTSVIIYHLADTKASRILYEEGATLGDCHLQYNLLAFLQLSRNALEHSAIKRAQYVVKIAMGYQSYQLVFVDESSCDRRTTYRNRAWAVRGRRAVRKTFFVRGRRYIHYPFAILSLANVSHGRYSILPALCHKGILNVDIVEGSYNTATFARFICGLLDTMNLFPMPNSVVVMDNCRIHKHPEILEMITSR